MDLSAIDTAPVANEGAEMHVRDGNGAPLFKADGDPVTITLLGEDSAVLTKLRNQQTNRYLRNQITVTAELAKANETEVFIAATIGWDGVGIGEEETAFSTEAARKLYAIPVIRDQVRAFIADRASFTKASPTA